MEFIHTTFPYAMKVKIYLINKCVLHINYNVNETMLILYSILGNKDYVSQ